MTSRTCLALFHTTHAVIKAERLLQTSGLAVRAVSVPRRFTSECGIGLRFSNDMREGVVSLLHEHDIPVAGVYDE